MVIDMLSIINNGEISKIDDNLLGAHIFRVEAILDDVAKITIFLTLGEFPEGLSSKE